MTTEALTGPSMGRYLDPHQAREREPTQFESLLGDALERAFGNGLHELPALVDALNRSGPDAPDGQAWTEASFTAPMARLGR